MKSIVRGTIVSCSIILLCAFSATSYAATQQSNFQIAPSPIAYPYFEEGRADGKIDVSFVSITMDNFSLAGAGGYFQGRIAFADFIALDGDLGLAALGGTMKPGISPMTWPTGYIPDPADQSSLFLGAFRFSLNLEIQPLHTRYFGLILFGGPNFNLSQFNITTKYDLIWIATGARYTGYTDQLQVTSTMQGGQFGVQLDIPLDENVRLSPFFMMSYFSGSATLTDNPGAAGASNTSMSADIPSSSTMTYGMDIIIGDISIGTMLQQLQSQQRGSNNAQTIIVTVGYHFSSAEENKTVE